MRTQREMYEAGTVCRTAVTIGTAKGETFTWYEPARFLFVKGPFPAVEHGEIGEGGPAQHEFWYETLSDPLNPERFYTFEPLDVWF